MLGRGHLVVPGSIDSLAGEVFGNPGPSPGKFLLEKRREQVSGSRAV